MQIAFVNLLRAGNILPAAVVGHSSGEIAAAYACQAITAKEAVMIAFQRGQALKTTREGGGMAAIGLNAIDISKYLGSGVTMACENSPISTTISGDDRQLNTICDKLRAQCPAVFVRKLNVDKAYHSRKYFTGALVTCKSLPISLDYMMEIAKGFELNLERYVKAKQPVLPFYSTVTGQRCGQGCPLDASYWRKNLESRVLFLSAMECILKEELGNLAFVEIGPHSSLAGPVKQILKSHGSANIHIPTLRKGEHSTKCILATVGILYLNKVPVNFASLHNGGRVLTDLPIYPWHHDVEYWNESRLSADWRLRKFPRHELLGARIPGGNDIEPIWRNILRVDEVPWLRDHKIHNDIVFPAAAFVAIAVEALAQIVRVEDGISVRHFQVKKALIINLDANIEIVTRVRQARLTHCSNSAYYEFSIICHDGRRWEENCTGEIKSKMEQVHQDEIQMANTRTVTTNRWYETLREVGLNYGSAFQRLTKISASTVENAALTTVEIEESPYLIHPTTLDGCLQLFSVAMSNGIARRFDKVYVPVSIEEIEVKPCRSNLRAQAQTALCPPHTIYGHARGEDDTQNLILSINGARLCSMGTSKEQEMIGSRSVAQLKWIPCVDFLDPAHIITPSAEHRDSRLLCEKLAILCIIESSKRLRCIEPPLDHIGKYRSWLAMQCTRASEGRYELIREAQDFFRMGATHRSSLIQDIAQEAQTTEAGVLASVILRVFNSIEEVSVGSLQPLELLMHENLLEKLYDWLVGDWRLYFQLLSHHDPNLSILEIGAGTGGTTSAVLASLASESGRVLCSKYTYTDVSSGFFGTAQERYI